MAVQIVDVLKVQPPLADLLDVVSAGDEVAIVRGAKPLARLIPAERPPKKRIAGVNAGAMRASDDFDEPLLIIS